MKRTFNLPNGTNRVPMMLDTYNYPVDDIQHFLGYLPNIEGYAARVCEVITPSGVVSGSLYWDHKAQWIGNSSGSTGGTGLRLNASKSSTTYGRNNLTFNNVIPASVKTLMVIKY